MLSCAVLCMDSVTLLQHSKISATQHIYKQTYVSRICSAPCQDICVCDGKLAHIEEAGVTLVKEKLSCICQQGGLAGFERT